jgi:hypothetical protein
VRLDKLARQVREITSDQVLPAGAAVLQLREEVPAQGARVYRIDY